MMKFLFSFWLMSALICAQGSPEKKNKSGSFKSQPLESAPMSKYSLLKSEVLTISGKVSLILTFNTKIQKYQIEKGNYNKIPVYSIHIPGCDAGNVEFPKIDSPVLFSEAVTTLRSDDTLDTYLHFYLESTIPPEIEQKEYLLRISFPVDDGVEGLWPHNIEKISYLSEDPYNLSIKLEFDEVPGKKNIFLTRNNKKVVIVLKNTVMDTNRFPPPAVPFIKFLNQVYTITESGISFCTLVFVSDGGIELKNRESNNKIFLDLKKRAIIADPGWLDN